MINSIRSKLKNSNNSVKERKVILKKLKEEVDSISKAREDMSIVSWKLVKEASKNNKKKNSDKFLFKLNKSGLLKPELLKIKKNKDEYYDNIISYSRINLAKKINNDVTQPWEKLTNLKVYLKENDKFFKIDGSSFQGKKYNSNLKKVLNTNESGDPTIVKTSEEEDRERANQVLRIISNLNEMFNEKDRNIAVSNLFTMLKEINKPTISFEKIFKGDSKKYLVIKSVAYKNFVKDIGMNGVSGLVSTTDINKKVNQIKYMGISYGISELKNKQDYEEDLDKFTRYLAKIQRYLRSVISKIRVGNNSVNIFKEDIDEAFKRFKTKVKIMEEEIEEGNTALEKKTYLVENSKEIANSLQEEINNIKDNIQKYNKIVKILSDSKFKKRIKAKPRLEIEKMDEIKAIQDQLVYQVTLLLKKLNHLVGSTSYFKQVPIFRQAINKIISMLPSDIKKKVLSGPGAPSSLRATGGPGGLTALASPLGAIGSSTGSNPTSLVVNGRKVFIPFVSSGVLTKTYGIISLSDLYDSKKSYKYTRLTDSRIKSLLYKNGYLVVNVHEDKTNNPVSWKVLKYNSVKGALENNNKQVRQEFILKLLSDPQFYVQKTTGWGGSKDSVKSNLKKFCGRLVKKKEYSGCDFITSIEEIGL